MTLVANSQIEEPAAADSGDEDPPTGMVSNVECVQFHGRVNLIHNNKIYLLKIICIFNIEIIRECCTYQNGIFESSFSFVILECIRLVCGSTVCEVVFAFLEF